MPNHTHSEQPPTEDIVVFRDPADGTYKLPEQFITLASYDGSTPPNDPPVINMNPGDRPHTPSPHGESMALVPAGYNFADDGQGDRSQERNRKNLLAGMLGRVAMAGSLVRESFHAVISAPRAIMRAIHDRRQARDLRRNPRTHNSDPVREPDGVSAKDSANRYRSAFHLDLEKRLRQDYWTSKRHGKQGFNFEAAGANELMRNLAIGALRSGVYDNNAISILKAAKTPEGKPMYTVGDLEELMYGHIHESQRTAVEERKTAQRAELEQQAAALGISVEELIEQQKRSRPRGRRQWSDADDVQDEGSLDLRQRGPRRDPRGAPHTPRPPRPALRRVDSDETTSNA